MSGKRNMRRMTFFVVLILLNLLESGSFQEQSENSAFDAFEKWFKSSGGYCNCRLEQKDGRVVVVATKDIKPGEPIITVSESAMITADKASKSYNGLIDTLPAELQSADLDYERHWSHLKIALFLAKMHSTKDPAWYPYTRVTATGKCDALWLWTKEELDELQDEKLSLEALQIQTFMNKLVDHYVPLLQEKGVIDEAVTKDLVMMFLCHASIRSIPVSFHGTTQETLLPVFDMLNISLGVHSKITTSEDSVSLVYKRQALHSKGKIMYNPGHKLTTPQVLLHHGILLPESESKFILDITGSDSKAHKELVNSFNIKNYISLQKKFTYKHAAFPYFRIRALNYETAKKYLKKIKDPKEQAYLKKIYNSPALQEDDTPVHSCKDEVIALNTLAAYLKVQFSELPTRILDDVNRLKKGVSERMQLAILYRKQSKTFLGVYYEKCSSRAADAKRRCLSKRFKDEL